MKIFLSIKYYPDLRNRALIEAISAALAAQGWQTVCIVRDVEQWGTLAFTPQALMQRTFDEIDACDLLLVEFSEKGVGLGIEAGYAAARGRPVVVLAPEGVEISTTLQGISRRVIRYERAVSGLLQPFDFSCIKEIETNPF